MNILKNENANNILVIAAHPDDEVLGCGATMARCAANGADISCLILGEGIASRCLDKNSKHEKIRMLKESSIKSNKILGVKNVDFADLPDNKFDSLPLLEIVKIIENKIAKIKPNIIFTHHKGDLNIDHRITFSAVLTAVRPLPESEIEAIFSFPILSSTEWGFGDKFSPSLYVDISQYLYKKIEALCVYGEEMRMWPHPRSLQAVEYQAYLAGCSVGKNAVEAFEINRLLF